MNQMKEALDDIATIKKAMDKNINNINSIYPIFIFLGIGHTVYFALLIISYYVFGISNNFIMYLTFYKQALFILSFIMFIYLFKQNARNLNQRKLFLLIGTCLFIKPFIFWLIGMVVSFTNSFDIASNALLLLNEYSVTIDIVMFCGILLLVGFNKNLHKTLIITILLIASYILVSLISKEIIDSPLVLISNGGTDLTLQLEGIFLILILTTGNILLGIFIKREKIEQV